MAAHDDWDGSPVWLFLLGLIVFLGSGLLFVADLLRGVDVLRSIAGNAVGVALLITWAAHDTLRNPDSEVGTSAGAAGTALLLYALYLLAAGVVIVLSGLVHDHMHLGFWYVGLAVLSVVVGYFIFPTEAVVGDGDVSDDSPDEHGPSGTSDDDQASDAGADRDSDVTSGEESESDGVREANSPGERT